MDSATRALETLQEDDGATMAMPAQLSLTQSSSGTSSCGKCYRQGDLTLGKVWALADPEDKGVLSKGELFIALCLVHCLAGQRDLCNGLPWAVKSEDKDRHGAILYRFKPRTWISVCDKGKPLSFTSKLPVAALGSIWELSGVGHGAKLTEMSLQVPWHIEESPCAHVLASSLCHLLRGKRGLNPLQKAKEDGIFLDTDKDMDEFVSGLEVCEIFLETVNQMLIKGLDPPLIFTPDVLPPPDRARLPKSIIGPNFSAIKELDALNNDTIDLKRDKNNVQEDLKEKEGTAGHAREEWSGLQQGTAGLRDSVESGRASWYLFRGTCMVHSRKSVECKWLKRKAIERKELETHRRPIDCSIKVTADPGAGTDLDCFQFDVFVGGDPFKADPSGEIGLFGGGPFKGSDPCTSHSFLRQSSPDPVATSGAEPFMQPASAVERLLLQLVIGLQTRLAILTMVVTIPIENAYMTSKPIDAN
ncbi:hypothetical protein QTO34_009922, partial [Cnephaeus nilssonii]